MIFTKSCPPSGFYVYAYLRNDGTPYYIGKGKNKRAWDRAHSVVVPLDQNRIITLETGLTEIGALAIERRMIAWYGRKDCNTGILRNRTEGGEGPSSADRLGNKNPMFGRKQSAESNRIRREKSLGRKFTEETRQKLSDALIGKRDGKDNPMFGRKHSAETVEKIREAKKGKIPWNKGKTYNLKKSP